MSPLERLVERLIVVGGVRTKRRARAIIDFVFETIADEVFGVDVIAGKHEPQVKRFIIPRFGSFRLKTHKARSGLDPVTRKKIHLPRREMLGFSPSKYLRRNVR